MALAGSMAGGIAGFLGNPAELIMVRMQADKAKPEGRACFSSSLPSIRPSSSNARSLTLKCTLAVECSLRSHAHADDRTVQLQKLYPRSSSND